MVSLPAIHHHNPAPVKRASPAKLHPNRPAPADKVANPVVVQQLPVNKAPVRVPTKRPTKNLKKNRLILTMQKRQPTWF